MALYLTLVAYEPEALAQLTKNPQDRTAAVREAAEARGAAAVITEEPDERAALAGAWTSEAVGHLKTFKSVPLFTVEETMEALRNAGDDIALRGPERWQPEW